METFFPAYTFLGWHFPILWNAKNKIKRKGTGVAVDFWIPYILKF